jgi:hypothetical protein
MDENAQVVMGVPNGADDPVTWSSRQRVVSSLPSALQAGPDGSLGNVGVRRLPFGMMNY